MPPDSRFIPKPWMFCDILAAVRGFEAEVY